MTHITLLDGGMGRELKARGVFGDGRLWSAQALIDAPDVVRMVHCDFLQAGAEVIITNNYAVVPRLIPDASARDRLITRAGTLAHETLAQSGQYQAVCGNPLVLQIRGDGHGALLGQAHIVLRRTACVSVPDQHLLLVSLVLICLLIPIWCPDNLRARATTPLKPDTPRRKRPKEPKPCTGLIHKP